MANKKNELYSSLCASCDEPHGGIGAPQYKDYINCREKWFSFNTDYYCKSGIRN